MKIRKNNIYIALAILAVILLSFIYFRYYTNSKENPPVKNETGRLLWFVDKDGYLYYPLDREEIKFRRDNYSETENLAISRVVYESKGANIYGLLVLPKNITEMVPGIILLPGAGVSKESELGLAKKIASLGAAVLTIDQRGVGETDAKFNSLKQDYLDFINSKEPVQHLMVYDVLKAYDLLYSAPFVDPDRIIVAGESLGGRLAIIAAATDRRINGVLAISSAGLDFEETNDTRVNIFLESIDSDHYINLIAPRKLVMIHGINDTIIPVSSAASSFSRAQEPKRFVLINDTSCNHGYCASMYEGLVESLDYLVDIRSRTLIAVPEKK
ncbi:alpha/beta fold hydrolase [Candidatus Woesearchaeota archaeon]|nr:alpha/beta fold hydrolase [Candidatus Woesearchaeota archaeon]